MVLAPGAEQLYRSPAHLHFRIHWTGDLDGDGVREVLFRSSAPGKLWELVCYTAEGKEKWRYRPRHRVSTAAENLALDWHVLNFLVGPAGKDGRRAIVAASCQHPYYPGSVALLSPEGKTEREYFHSGHLHALEKLSASGTTGWRILAGGVNNAERRAELVILDPAKMGGASVEREASYQLLHFPPGEEEVRVLFPATAIAKALDRYDVVQMVERHGTGMRVTLNQVWWESMSDTLFSLALPPRLESVGLGDGYRMMVRRLAREGVMREPFDYAAEAARLEREGVEVFTSRDRMNRSSLGRPLPLPR